MVEMTTEQATRLKVANGRGGWGVRLLSGLINLSIPVGMLLLILQRSGAALPSFEVFALVGLASLAVVVSMGRGFDRAPMRLAASVNDNQPGEVAPGSELADALRRSRSAFWGVGLLSGLINILMLTGPLFMLQIYDRVLPSHNIPTLVGLAILTAGLFALQGVLDAIRGRILLRIGSAINQEMSSRAYDAVARLPLKTRGETMGCSQCAISTKSAAF